MGFEPMTLYTLGECCLVDYVISIIFFGIIGISAKKN